MDNCNSSLQLLFNFLLSYMQCNYHIKVDVNFSAFVNSIF